MIGENIQIIKDNISSSATDPNVIVVAATKTVEASRIDELKNYGILDVGENRVQELMAKYPEVEGMRWHFIGALQTNKVKYIVDKVCLIHSVESLALAQEINKRAAKINRVMDVLVEVNIGREPSKCGVLEEDLWQLLDEVNSLQSLRLRGLMTVMPQNAEEHLYQKMQDLYLEAGQKFPTVVYLSMGMSSDYQTALRYGANIIRIGSALFGARPPKTNKQ